MSMCFVDVDRDPRSRAPVRRRRSVSFSSKEVRKPSAIRTTSRYTDAPPYTPFTSSTVQVASPREGHTFQIPGAFPTTATTHYTAPATPYYHTAPITPTTSTKQRSYLFADYLPSLPSIGGFGTGWSGLIGGSGKKDNTSTMTERDVKKNIEHERTLRMYAEQRHQETIKQQLLELEIAKSKHELEQRTMEDEARARIHDVCMLSLAEQAQQQAMQIYQPPPAVVSHHHHHHSSPPRFSSHHEERRYRRDHHICSRCGHRGHYSKYCRVAPPSRMLGPGPSSAPVRGYLTAVGGGASTVGGYSTDDDEWVVGHEEYYDHEIDENGYPVAYDDDEPRHNGVLVYYEGGAAPGTAAPRSSVRHVIGL